MKEDKLPEIKQFMAEHKQDISLREYSYFEYLINELENGCCKCLPKADTWIDED